MDNLNPRPPRPQRQRPPKKLRAQAKPSVTMEPPNTSEVTEVSADNAVAPSETPIQQVNRLQVRIGHINAIPTAADTVMFQAELTPTDLVPTKSDHPNSPFIMQTRNFQQFRLGGAHVHLQPLFPMSTGAQISCFYLPPGANMPTDLSVTSLACLQFCVTRSGDRPLNLTIPGSVLCTLNDGWCTTVPNEANNTPGRIVIVQHAPAINPFTQTSGAAPLPYDQAYLALTVGLVVCMRGQAAQNMVVTQHAAVKEDIKFGESEGQLVVTLPSARLLSASRRQQFHRRTANGFGAELIQVAKIALDVAASTLPPPFNWLTNAGGWFLRRLTSSSNEDTYAVFLNRRDATFGQPLSAPPGTNAATKVQVSLRMVEDTGGLPPGLDVIPTRTNMPAPQPPAPHNLSYEDQLVASSVGNTGLLWDPDSQLMDVMVKQVRGYWESFLLPSGQLVPQRVHQNMKWGSTGQYGFDAEVIAGICRLRGHVDQEVDCITTWFIRTGGLYVVSPSSPNDFMVTNFQPATGVNTLPILTNPGELLIMAGSRISDVQSQHVSPIAVINSNGVYMQNNVTSEIHWPTPLYYADMYHPTTGPNTMVGLTTYTTTRARHLNVAYTGFTTPRVMSIDTAASAVNPVLKWVGPGDLGYLIFTNPVITTPQPPKPTLGSEGVQLDLLARLADLLVRNLGLSLDQEHALALCVNSLAEEGDYDLASLPPVDMREQDSRPKYYV
uniref:Capsid protein n=1 Tax=Wenling samurai squirrelfish hepevirus TaxID=2116399 RepID=A0A2P1GMP0_9VIRU|nr:capsid protein [Wenling samurai squirrelfish hepevirus]